MKYLLLIGAPIRALIVIPVALFFTIVAVVFSPKEIPWAWTLAWELISQQEAVHD